MKQSFEETKARLLWRCRRGMLELDLILQPYVENNLEQLSADDIAVFERMLAEPDPELYSWLMDFAEPADKEFQAIVLRIRNSR